MGVLEHEQQRPAPGRIHEELGDGVVQAVALGVLVGDHRFGQVADEGGEVGNQAPELAAAGAQVSPQVLGIRDPGQMVERLRDGLVGEAHDRVARAVQHQHPVRGGVLGELPHEPALARPGLSADEGDAPALTACARQERAQERQLPGTADERKRRREPEGSGELGCGVEDRHSQI